LQFPLIDIADGAAEPWWMLDKTLMDDWALNSFLTQ